MPIPYSPLSMNWQMPPSILLLNDQMTHVWQVDLDLAEESVNDLKSLLSDDEITKGDRFHFAHHRRRYIVARGMLRKILGRYLEVKPDQIEFQYTDKGKPFLSSKKHTNNFQFNLSHSEEKAIYGVTLNRWIGVDIEKQRPIKDILALTNRFFCPQEAALIQSLPDEERAQIFFQLWTAKEAYLKGMGTGISGGLDQVALRWCKDQLKPLPTQDHWSLLSFIIEKNYLGAVAIEGKEGIVQYYLGLAE